MCVYIEALIRLDIYVSNSVCVCVCVLYCVYELNSNDKLEFILCVLAFLVSKLKRTLCIYVKLPLGGCQ